MNPDRDPKPVDADLRALFHAAAPDEPGEAEWSAALEAIHRGLERPRVTPVLHSPGRWRGMVVVAAALVAAAVLIALVLPSSRKIETPREDEAPVVAELPVMDADDVEILSVDTADAGAIVVGELPHTRPIVWAEPGDVALQGESPADVHMHSDDTPMLWVPLAAGGTPRP